MAQSTQPTKTSPGVKTKKQGPSALVKYYLVAYNVLSTVAWGYVLARTCAHLAGLVPVPAAHPLAQYVPSFISDTLAAELFRAGEAHALEQYLPPALVPVLRRASTAYAAVGTTTLLVQSMAALEVLHTLFGWVRAPLGTTAAQVASRLYMVWGITYFFPHTRTHALYASMVLSWALTEVVRYSFYALSLLGGAPRALVWARYSLFVVLYLTGAGSEAGLIYASLPARAAAVLPAWTPCPRVPSAALALAHAPGAWAAQHAAFRAAMYVVWWFSLYVLYNYMLGQRRRVLGGGRTLGAKPKTL